MSVPNIRIPFNKPFLTGNELHYIGEAVKTGKISGNGIFTEKCHHFFESRYGFNKCLLTTSCTDALEMAAILLDIQPGDEVIMPSYTFVSTANAFVLRGAHIIFVDSRDDHPGMDEKKVEELINAKTKAIVVVHYAGVACDMDIIMDIAERHSLFVVEDAAQAIDSFYKNRPLGGIGHLAAFSFHETKNIQCGEGGMLVINDPQFEKRAEIIWEKGTNRSAFFRGEIDKYGWVDIGSSFLPSEVTAAFLYAQLENLEEIQKKRVLLWKQYDQIFRVALNLFKLPEIPEFATNNAHMYYLIFLNQDSRQVIIDQLKKHGVLSVFHYLSLHKSKFFLERNPGFSNELVQSDRYSDCLLRLPLYYQLKEKDVQDIAEIILQNQGQ
jgi:dTDP-4-amino-4,6-dideoxygalactose transaminase